jgi:hypothetical protein
MKKNYPLARCAALLLMIVLLSHCVKYPNCLPDNPWHYEITQIKGGDYFSPYDTINITYNSRHNPIQIAGHHITEAYPQYLLGYDPQNAPRVLIGAFYDGNPGFITADKYSCDNKKRVVLDSVFLLGDYDRSSLTIISARYLYYVRKYTYDNQNRVTQTIDKRFLLVDDLVQIITTSYYYNSSGNAYRINKVILYPNQTRDSSDIFPVYDNKVNPHQLHPMWQFLDLDYSKNNAFIADSYNQYGLPLKVPSTKSGSRTFLLFPFTDYEIVYRHQ